MNRAKEPIIIIGTIEVAVLAIIGVLAPLLGWDLEFAGEVEVAATTVLAAIGAVAIVIGTWWGRRKVTPVDAPNLPVGTVVNEGSDEPTSVVKAKPVPKATK